jgi:hypothetical protein
MNNYYLAASATVRCDWQCIRVTGGGEINRRALRRSACSARNGIVEGRPLYFVVRHQACMLVYSCVKVKMSAFSA